MTQNKSTDTQNKQSAHESEEEKTKKRAGVDRTLCTTCHDSAMNTNSLPICR